MLVFGSGHVARVIKGRCGKDASMHTQVIGYPRLVDHHECDITDASALRRVLGGSKDRWVVNATGLTDVDWCEDNRAECLAVNGHAPVTLGLLCQEMGKVLVHISTGCMFDGTVAPVTEETSPSPILHYSKCKVLADYGLLMMCPNSVLILRPRMLVSGRAGTRSNYVNKVMAARVYRAHLELNSVTYVPDIADFIGHAVRNELRGIYNIACPQPVTPHWVASRVADGVALRVVSPERRTEVELVSHETVQAGVRNRRVNVVLSTRKAEATGFSFTPVEDAIQASILGVLGAQ